jgi:Secretory lipase
MSRLRITREAEDSGWRSAFRVDSAPLALVLAASIIGAVALAVLADGRMFAQSISATKPHSSRHTLQITKFYDAPTPLPPGKPGTLIRFEQADEYDLSAEFSATRILYHSRSGSGEHVAASGVVLIPDGKPPAGGWPVIAWAHGFIGAARICAPSLMRNLGSGPFLSMYLSQGYAVVATDYAGLGTNFRNAVMDIPSNAADLINSVAAARAAAPQLGPKWVALGRSEGGWAVVAAAEMESEMRDPNFLGSVAIGGIADLKEIFEGVVKEERSSKESSEAKLVLLAYAIKSVYSQFQASEILTEKGMALYGQVDKDCAGPTTEAASAPQVLKQDWERNQFVQQFFERNRIGTKPAPAPLLLLSSEGDQMVPKALNAATVARLCKQRVRVQSFEYRGPELGVLGDSVRDQIAWIQDRFAGKPAPSSCR